jgi:hypothetical protein
MVAEVIASAEVLKVLSTLSLGGREPALHVQSIKPAVENILAAFCLPFVSQQLSFS